MNGWAHYWLENHQAAQNSFNAALLEDPTNPWARTGNDKILLLREKGSREK
jgi:hypothetical protein